MTTAGTRILIIDDDAHFVDTVASFLADRQFTVFRAETGQEGLRLAKAERPDLILMDIIIGERTEGSLTIQEVRRTEELKGVPIFILSWNCVNLPDLQTPGSGWLPDDVFIQKPVNLFQLLDKIEHTLAGLHKQAHAGHFDVASAEALPKGRTEPELASHAGGRKAS